MRKIVYILRGVPGSGKSTLARELTRPDLICSADDYFVDANGQYKWDANKLGAAHKACREKLESLCIRGESPLVVDNTHIRLREMSEAYHIGNSFGYEIREIIFWPADPPNFDKYVDDCATRNTHGVPRQKIEQMARTLLSQSVQIDSDDYSRR